VNAGSTRPYVIVVAGPNGAVRIIGNAETSRASSTSPRNPGLPVLRGIMRKSGKPDLR
jgi:hypothetical protein